MQPSRPGLRHRACGHIAATRQVRVSQARCVYGYRLGTEYGRRLSTYGWRLLRWRAARTCGFSFSFFFLFQLIREGDTRSSTSVVSGSAQKPAGKGTRTGSASVSG